jgi:hypothetical protein
MSISLNEAAAIIGKSADDVKLLVQASRLTAVVDPNTLNWSFDLTELLRFKENFNEESFNSPQLLVE